MKEFEGDGLRAAVIGLGKMGILHACILNVIPGVKLVALCEKSALMRRLASKALMGVRIVDDVEKLSGLDLDFVYITTPIPSHFSIAKTIYTSRISRCLFVEKTLGASSDEAEKLCELAENYGGTNAVGYMKRFSVTFRKALSLLKLGVLGDVISFSAYSYSSDFVDVKKGSGIGGSRGGVLGDLGSHVVDLALWFFGDFQVESALLKSLNRSASEDHVNFKVKGSRNLEGVFDISWCIPGYRMPESGLIIKGSKGSLEVNDDEVDLQSSGQLQRWYRPELNDNVDFLICGPEYFREDKSFVESVRNGSSAKPDFRTASKVDWLLDQVKRSAELIG
jgi:predicted dehydrogenase